MQRKKLVVSYQVCKADSEYCEGVLSNLKANHIGSAIVDAIRSDTLAAN